MVNNAILPWNNKRLFHLMHDVIFLVLNSETSSRSLRHFQDNLDLHLAFNRNWSPVTTSLQSNIRESLSQHFQAIWATAFFTSYLTGNVVTWLRRLVSAKFLMLNVFYFSRLHSQNLDNQLYHPFIWSHQKEMIRNDLLTFFIKF